MSAFHSPQSLEERSENLPDPNHREQQVMQAQVVPGATQLEGETSGPNYGDVEAHRPQGTQDMLPNGVDRGLRVPGQGRTLPASIGERGESGSQSAAGEAGAERVHGTAVTEGVEASIRVPEGQRAQSNPQVYAIHTPPPAPPAPAQQPPPMPQQLPEGRDLPEQQQDTMPVQQQPLKAMMPLTPRAAPSAAHRQGEGAAWLGSGSRFSRAMVYL